MHPVEDDQFTGTQFTVDLDQKGRWRIDPDLSYDQLYLNLSSPVRRTLTPRARFQQSTTRPQK